MASRIKHVVVLMLENRSFDHMLGFLRSPSYPIDGLTGAESNPLDPHRPSAEIKVSPTAGDVLPLDPGHGFADVNVQLFANPSGPSPSPTDLSTPSLSPNSGFVFSYSQQTHVTPAIAPTIMNCFAPQRLPVLTRLAREFAVCDRWFSSVPGPTWPNRCFAHCATSKGFLDNSAFNNYDMPTVFEQLGDAGLSWKVYFHDVAQALALERLAAAEQVVNFLQYPQFARNAKQGTLPNYAFIEPRYFSAQANDQHPPHDVSLGEALIADVYNVIRNSTAWNECLLLILYDEHGGTYDHVAPPAAIPPDANTGQFAFDRYGVRVPAIVVSPFVEKGSIVHDALDHASIPATLRKIFGLGAALTARDESAATFDAIASLAQARTDAPTQLVASGPPMGTTARALQGSRAASIVSPEVVSNPLSDWQRSLIDLAGSLGVRHRAARGSSRAFHAPVPIESEDAGGRYVKQATQGYLKRAKAAIPIARKSRAK